MNGMLSVPINGVTVGLSILLITNLIVVVLAYGRLTAKVDGLIGQQKVDAIFRKETLAECNRKHDLHFAHESNTGIHQESMGKELLQVRFDNIAKQLVDLSDTIKHSHG